MSYKEKIQKGLSVSKTFEDIEYLEDKIRTTSQINRMTKVGRELTEELLKLANQRRIELISEGKSPF